MALSANHEVTVDERAIRRPNENPLRYWLRVFGNRGQGDVVVKSDSALTLGRRSRSAAEVGVLHHIELDRRRSSLKGRVSLWNYNRRLRKLDYVVAVSRFWADYLESIACKNIRVIYNAFDLKEFAFSQNEIDRFLAEQDIRSDRPIVYIGYALSNKGVTEAFDALKDSDYTLVMTGRDNQDLGIPVRNLSLDRRDYLCLLSACDVVVTMSTVEEGWNRIAHEAMLCRTPVIGSGRGGMRELLEGGGQTICGSFAELPRAVSEVLARKDELGLRGHSFAKEFDLESFEEKWDALLEEVIG